VRASTLSLVHLKEAIMDLTLVLWSWRFRCHSNGKNMAGQAPQNTKDCEVCGWLYRPFTLEQGLVQIAASFIYWLFIHEL